MMQFTVGLAIAIVAALMMYCQERCFLRVDLEFWPVVLGIFGIGLIASSSPLLGKILDENLRSTKSHS